MTNLRIGHGYDVHKLGENRDLVLGGVTIPHKLGLVGHSDADVLVHAIMDSLLGAANLPDIGVLFPDKDDSYLNISSLILLEKVKQRISEANWEIVNIDATIIAQAPKLRPYIESMKCNISEVLELDIHQINIKATTEEHLGFTGQELGIAAHAVALIEAK